MAWNTNLKNKGTKRARYRALATSCLCAVVPVCLLSGCAHVENQFREDGPAVDAEWNSPTAADVYARFEPAAARMRPWEVTPTQSESGAVTHGPDYFQDPFEDQGAAAAPVGGSPSALSGEITGRGREHRIDWVDAFATPYGYARYTLNGLFLPVSMVVTPPWTEMESDGVLSEQALGPDHDPAPTGAKRAPRVPPAAGDSTAEAGAPPSADARPATGSPPRMNGLQVNRP